MSDDTTTDAKGPPATTGRPTPERWKVAIRRPVAPFPCWLALAFGWVSIFPTLLPRAAWAQGVITGVSVVLGMALGALVSWLAAVLWRWSGRGVPTVLPYGRRVFAAVAAIVTVAGLGAWVTWQNEQRRGIGMDTVGPLSVVPVVVVAVVVGALLFVIGRTVALWVRRLDRRITRYVPRPVAVAATVVIVSVGAVVITRDVVLTRILDSLNESFGTFDDETPPGIAQPTSPLRSGGPGSLVPWDTLGYEGRHFTGGGPTVADLQSFAGPRAQVKEPIRVYAGLKSAAGPEAEARLAVEELDRTDAWSRSVLSVVTVTGTGWIDPVSASSLEYLRNGDTAIVGTQYSYFPSWISFLVDLDRASENAKALVGAVTDRWLQLPADHRPQLVIFGLSLGSYGSEQAFLGPDLQASLANATATPNAVLWAGPTFANDIWQQVVAGRAPGSPSWAPDVPGITLRGSPDQPPQDGRLPGTPVLYLTHPTDPVTWASVDSLWRKPDWMAHPYGTGLYGPFLWAPGVTLLQEVFDLMAGFSASPGYGHNYNPTMPDAWVAVAAPPGWTSARTTALRTAVADFVATDPVG